MKNSKYKISMILGCFLVCCFTTLYAQTVSTGTTVATSTTTTPFNYEQHYGKRTELFKAENIEIIAKSKTDKIWEQQIVMLGDSLTEGFNLKKSFPDKPFVNRGIVSDHTAWTNERGLLYRLTPNVLAPNPAHIFILIGVNDIAAGMTSDKSISYYKNIIDTLKTTYPDAKIYVQSCLPARGRYARLNNVILEYNTKLVELAKQCNLPYIELHSLYKDAIGELKEEFTRDGIHLKQPAYEIWKSELEKVLDIAPPMIIREQREEQQLVP